MGLIGSAEPFYSSGTYGIEQFKSILIMLASMDYKNHTFDANIGFVNSFVNLMGSVEPIKIYLSLPLKNLRLTNPRELKPREAGIPAPFQSMRIEGAPFSKYFRVSRLLILASQWRRGACLADIRRRARALK